MEKCVFCGWTRRTAYPSIRFFGIPKEPGLKRIQWLYVLGDREIGPKDRVCSVHFRQGRPSSDPSHEDFVPHLYLNQEPPPEVISYLESLAETKNVDSSGTPKVSKPTTEQATPQSIEYNKKPSILKRKRRTNAGQTESSANLGGDEAEEPSELTKARSKLADVGDETEPRRVKLHLLQRSIADAVGVKPGQTVIIKRKIAVPRSNAPETNKNASVTRES